MTAAASPPLAADLDAGLRRSSEQRKLRAEEGAQVEGPKKQKPPEGGFHRRYLMRSRDRLADLPVVRPPNNDWSCSVT